MNIYEKAIREKLRFDYKGLLTVEDLWDLDVKELDKLFKVLNSQKKEISEESLLDTKTNEDNILDTKIEIIKHIVFNKQEEKKILKLRAENKEKKERLKEILAKKQDSELENLSAEELQEMLKEL
jgi:frataxin-like iron-binding protein CyaY